MRNLRFDSFKLDFETMAGPIVLDPDFHSDPKLIKELNKFLQNVKSLKAMINKPNEDILTSYKAYSQEKQVIDLYKKENPFLLVRPDSGF